MPVDEKLLICFGKGFHLPAGKCSTISIRAEVVKFEVLIVMLYLPSAEINFLDVCVLDAT